VSTTTEGHGRARPNREGGCSALRAVRSLAGLVLVPVIMLAAHASAALAGGDDDPDRP
jgi:hypothetical protein